MGKLTKEELKKRMEQLFHKDFRPREMSAYDKYVAYRNDPTRKTADEEVADRITAKMEMKDRH